MNETKKNIVYLSPPFHITIRVVWKQEEEEEGDGNIRL